MLFSYFAESKTTSHVHSPLPTENTHPSSRINLVSTDQLRTDHTKIQFSMVSLLIYQKLVISIDHFVQNMTSIAKSKFS